MSTVLDDPASFDIYARIEKSAIRKYAEHYAQERGISLLQAYQSMSPGIKIGKLVQIFVGRGWTELPGLLASLPEFVVQDTAAISDDVSDPNCGGAYCEVHRLYHHHLGCPVCAGTYLRYRRIRQGT